MYSILSMATTVLPLSALVNSMSGLLLMYFHVILLAAINLFSVSFLFFSIFLRLLINGKIWFLNVFMQL